MSVPSPIRVLHVVRPASGGIRQHLINLIRHSDPALVSISIAGPQAFLQSLPSDLLCMARHELDIAGKTNLARDVMAAARLSRIVKHDTDIVHAHGVRAAWVAALAGHLTPFPLVFTAHNLLDNSTSARIALRLIGPRSDKLVAVSPSVAQNLIQCGAPEARTVVIPNGIDLDYFKVTIAGARSQFDLSDGDFVVGCIARLSPEKGLDILALAAQKLPDIKFIVAGDGPMRGELEGALPPNVRLLGQLADVRPVLAACDILAIPSRLEGQGIAALEAMASGTPCVASRVGGLAEMLEDGETALLVPPASPDALADAIRRLQHDPTLRAKLSENAGRLARDQYDVKHMTRQLSELYEAVRTQTIVVE